MDKIKLRKTLRNLTFPESLNQIETINPTTIPLDLTARLSCMKCGLYKRGILCPPHLWLTYPQFKTYESTRKFLEGYEKAVVFVWKNDGTKSWKVDKNELKHIEFKVKKGRQLKGTEAGQARELTKLMFDYRSALRKTGYKAFALIPGHCDLCAHKCPNRDNPPCRHGGAPSLESIGIDVYQMLKDLNIEYEYPVINYLTQVTMLLVEEK